MTIVREYRMTARQDGADGLRTALAALAAALADLPGLEGADLMQDMAAPERFVFRELWASVQARTDAAPLVSKEALAQVMAQVGEPPQAATYEVIRPL